jgi:hypothetical protein
MSDDVAAGRLHQHLLLIVQTLLFSDLVTMQPLVNRCLGNLKGKLWTSSDLLRLFLTQGDKAWPVKIAPVRTDSHILSTMYRIFQLLHRMSQALLFE